MLHREMRRRRLADHPRRTRQADNRIEEAYRYDHLAMRRLLAAMPAESRVDREEHAANIVLTLADARRHPQRLRRTTPEEAAA